MITENNYILNREEALKITADKVKIKETINFDCVNNDVKVSIVVPVCNVERYLKKCLDSIAAQTLKDLEIICVNDGSSDMSETILEKYAKKDRRFKIINKENAGYGHTMNIGMDMAKGEYIGIVESDDYIERDMFECLYNAAKSFQSDIVKSDYYTFKTAKRKIDRQYQSTCLGKNFFYNKVLSPKENKEIFTFHMNTWTGIYRRDFLTENNIRHNESPGASYQDNGFWFQTISLCQSIVFLNKAFYHYRQDNPNSSINSKKKVFCMNKEYDYIFDFINNHKNVKEYIVQYFSKKYYNYMYTYNRIAPEFKLPYLKRFSEELQYAQANKIVDLYHYPDNYVASMCLRIMDDYKCFYLQDSIYRYETRIADAKERLAKLRASNELRVGRRLADKILGFLGR